MSARLRVSVAMINYNYGRYLPGALASVLQQTRPVDEVVVVDDGSTDDSRDVLAEAARQDGRIRVVEQANAGAAAACTRAVLECTGDVVLMLDSDDLALPRRAEAVEAAYLAHPDAGWVWHQLEHVERPTMAVLSTAPVQKGFTAGLHDHRVAVARGALPLTAPATSALSWRRPLLQRLLPVPVRVHVHDNYLKQASLGLAPGVVVDEVLSQQGIHTANVTTGVSRAAAAAIRTTTAVDIAPALRGLGLESLSERFWAEALLGSRGGRTLSSERRQELVSFAATTPARRWPALLGALGVAGARAGRGRLAQASR